MSTVFENQESEKRYFILTLERGDELDRGRQGWLTYMGKDATAISASSLRTALNPAIKQEKKCIVAIHAHGAAPNLQTKGQSVYTKDPGKMDQYKNEEDYMQAHKQAQMNAQEFAEYLVDKKLPKETKELRILACYTDRFSEDLVKELAQQGYENMTVVGYKGEFSICQGVNGSSLAGLDPQLIPELYEDSEINWENLTKKIQTDYASDKHEARFNSSAYFIRKEEEDIKQSLLSSSPPIKSHYTPTVASPSTSLSNSSEPSTSANSSTDYSEEERVRRGREEGRAAAEAAVTKEKIERELQQAERRTQEERDRNRSASPKKPNSDEDSSPLRSRTPSPGPKSSS